MRTLKAQQTPAARRATREPGTASPEPHDVDRLLVTLTAGELRELVTDVVESVLVDHDAANDEGPVLLDRKGLALKLGCSLRTLDILRAQGMPERRLIDSPRFLLLEVLEWLGSRRDTESSASPACSSASGSRALRLVRGVRGE